MKRAYFTIADAKNLPYAQAMGNSLKKFDKDAELILFGEEQVKATKDPDFFYRATPYIAKMLMEDGYDQVCKIDADCLVLGDLLHIWEGEFDVAVVNNSSPRDYENHLKTTGQKLSVLNINPMSYLCNSLVVMKNKAFVDHWYGLCFSEHFPFYQFREQDFLNIMVFYMPEIFNGPYKVKFLDNSNKWHGSIAKGYTPQAKLINGKVILEKNDEWPKDEDKQLVVYHYGGNSAKGKYKLIFNPEVSKYIDELVK